MNIRVKKYFVTTSVVMGVMLMTIGNVHADEQKKPTSTKKTSTTKKKAPKKAKEDNAIIQVKKYINRMKKEKKINMKDKAWRTNLPIFTELKYMKDKKYYWNLETNQGDIRVRFFPGIAPNHVSNFIYLSTLKFFDGLKFHRVIKNFMAQGGDPLGNGRGDPGYRFKGEFSSKIKHSKPGMLSMANAGPGTDGSQFFLTFVPTPWLNGKHTIFGEVVDGMKTLKELERRGSSTGRTLEPLFIKTARITVE